MNRLSDMEIYEAGLKALNIEYSKDNEFDREGNICGYVVRRQNDDTGSFIYFDLNGAVIC